MRQYSSLANRTNTILPPNKAAAHQLCFTVHDIMAQLLVSGQRAKAFRTHIEFRDDADRLAFENADDIFMWLDQSRRLDERADLLVTIVFPAVLSDMLHCFYEALESSRKAKLSIAFMLLRKPLQESLFLLESVIADRQDFGEKLNSEPMRLRSQKAGGIDAHAKRIQKVLELIGEDHRFDARYIAQLRYDKESQDGFDGICNKALHLFTDHKAIRTAPLNINFIFSDISSTMTQWSYLYSRLPYLLVYIHCIVEHVCATIAPTDPVYLDDMARRISAQVLLWWDTVEPSYYEQHLRNFVFQTRDWLFAHCKKAGYAAPSRPELAKMADTGAYPNELQNSIAERNLQFVHAAIASGSLIASPAGRAGGFLTKIRYWCNRILEKGRR